jgi:hypothetical protein
MIIDQYHVSVILSGIKFRRPLRFLRKLSSPSTVFGVWMPQSNLEPYEQTWVTLQPFLLSRGYLTSPRYKPGWKAPKKENDSNESTYERVCPI